MDTPNPTPPGEYSSARLWLKDMIEKAGSTLVQALVPIVCLILASEQVDWTASFVALFAGVGSVVLAFIPQLRPTGLSYAADVAWRLGRTVVVTTLSMLIAAGVGIFEPAIWQAVVAELGIVLGVFLKAEVAQWLGDASRGAPDAMPQITPASLAQVPKEA